MPPVDPIVSIIIANFNGARFLPEALASARSQTLRDIEIIVIDDASTDGSREIANAVARQDSRIRVLALEAQSGPGAARNEGLAAAKGRWIAILDNDDLMHPSRLEQLVATAEAENADLVADDLLIFGEGIEPASLLSPRQRSRRWISAADFIAGNKLLTREPVLGYLKPVIRTAFLRQHGLSYTPDLSIGEDYDLVVQLMSKGARFRLVGTLGYFYRKHSQSISHRMSGDNVARMLAADVRLRTLFEPADTAVARAFEIRKASIERAASYAATIAALKNREWRRAAEQAIANPRVLPLLAMPVTARIRRLTTPRTGRQPADTEKRVALISRQRLIGNSNGSSAYVLALAKALRDDGHKITLISPSMSTFGRWPFLRMRPEMDVFDEIHIRGAWKIGRGLYIAKHPPIALAAALTVASRLLARLGVTPPKSWDRPAPYAIAEPWHREDQIFIARNAPPAPRLVLADYAFTTPAIPYALAPSARSAVIMHDFFSVRAERFREQNLADSVAYLDQATELRLLAGADAVIAIQKVEGAEIARLLPEREVIVAPLASRVKNTPQPGDDRTILFVGSNTAPNVIGLQWFIDAMWPEIRRRVPDVRLLVAGSVTSAFPSETAGVSFLGMVADLDPLYTKAGVVISPLTVGSGLKIKLVEALGQGKAVVATSVTTEGYEEAAIAAIFEHDEPQLFADAIVDLLTNESLRRAKAAEALDVARRLYSPEACYRGLLSFANAQATAAGLSSEPASPTASTTEEGWGSSDASRTANGGV